MVYGGTHVISLHCGKKIINTGATGTQVMTMVSHLPGARKGFTEENSSLCFSGGSLTKPQASEKPH